MRITRIVRPQGGGIIRYDYHGDELRLDEVRLPLDWLSAFVATAGPEWSVPVVCRRVGDSLEFKASPIDAAARGALQELLMQWAREMLECHPEALERVRNEGGNDAGAE